MENNKQIVRPFGMRDKLGYMFGDFGNDFTYLLSSSFLLKFYTDIMGVSGAIVGIIMMIARIVDAFTDVTMGRICDRSKTTPAGKFKPWIRRMAVPIAIASFLIYQSDLSGMSLEFKTIWLFVTYILWGSFFYTAINIPYGSMASAISSEPGDRQSLSSFRTMGSMFAGTILMVGIPMLSYDKIDGNSVLNGDKFTFIAGICSVATVICYLLCYHLVTERVRTESNAEYKQDSVIRMFKKAFTNRALISIIAASVTMLLAQLTMQGMANYVYPNYYGDTSAQALSSLMMTSGLVIAAIIAKPMANRFGKAEIGAVASFAAAFVNIFIFVLRPENVLVYVFLQAVSWIGLGLFSMVSWALITDVIDASELQYGVREDGVVYALYSWARKLGQAASAGLTGVLLSMIGYTERTAFDSTVKEGIFNVSCLVPAIGFLILGIILWFWYPLHKKQVDANVAALKIKHSE